MRDFVRFIISAATIVATCYGQASNTVDAAKQVEALEEGVRLDRVGKIEVLQLPLDLSYRFAISPETLDRTGNHVLTIRNMSTTDKAILVEILHTAAVVHRDGTSDVRRGLILYTPTGQRIGALYFERNSRAGFVNNSPVFFNAGFFQMLKDAMHLPVDY